MIGADVLHFKIVEKLGEGGMGQVYKAEDTRLRRVVALKFLHEMTGDDEATQRFLREARAVAALNHPHICTIYETGEFEGRPFIVMEYLEGKTLQDALIAGPLSPEALLSLSLQLTDALCEAHDKGILHRDLKPANVFLGEKGRTKLLDFGLAKSLNPADGHPDARKTGQHPFVTETGLTLGTIGYMSPEQVRGDDLDHRSDLFSLGVVLYQASTGIPPFTGNTSWAILNAILNETPKSPSKINPSIAASMEDIIMRLLEKEPGNRLQTAADVRDALVRRTTYRDSASAGVRRSPGEEPDAHEPSRSTPVLPSLGVRLPGSYSTALYFGIVLSSFALGFLYIGIRNPVRMYWPYIAACGIPGVLLLTTTSLLRVRARRRSVVDSRSGGRRLVRFESSPESPGVWVSFRWLMLILGLVNLFAVVRALVRIAGSEPFEAGLFLNLFGAMVGIGAFLMSRSWGKEPRSLCRRNTEIELEESFAQIVARCSMAITSIDGYVTDLDLDNGYIRARTPYNWSSMGERVTLRIRPSDRGRHKVWIESECVNLLQTFDWGKNGRNLTSVMDALAR